MTKCVWAGIWQNALGEAIWQNNSRVGYLTRWVLEGYLKEVDGITTRSQGFQNQFQFVNAIGQYAVQGLDLLLYQEFNRANFWFSYSFQNNDYNFKDLNGGVSFPNNTEISHAVALAGTLDLNRLKISGGMNWRTGKPYTRPAIEGPASGATIIFEDPNSSNLNDYLRVDLSATYDMRLGEKTTAKAGLAIWNLLDKENILNRYFVVGQDQSVNAVENYSLGITPNFTFRVHFNWSNKISLSFDKTGENFYFRLEGYSLWLPADDF